MHYFCIPKTNINLIYMDAANTLESQINRSDYKILIVDDVVSNVLLLKILLTNEKFQVCTANCGNMCIEQARAEKPDLILLDVMMPDISGFDTAVILKKDPELKDIPIIFLTALNSPADLVKGFQVGANDFLSKPFNKEELVVRVMHQIALVAAKRLIEKQNRELLATINNRDKMYSVIAHDLRSPMASIRMVLNLAVAAISPDVVGQEIFELIDKANKESEDVHDLLDNLLKWTKSQTGRLNVVYQDIDLDDVQCISKSFPGFIDVINNELAPSKMQSIYRGDVLKLRIYGQSHSKRIGVYIEGLPDSVRLDEEYTAGIMARRAPGKNKWSTSRVEADEVHFEKIRKMVHGYIINTNTKPKDYESLLNKPRPSHADYTARFLYGDDAARSGGGIFSGRMTAPLCIAGSIAKCELEKRGIKIYSHLLQIGEASDVGYYEGFTQDEISKVQKKELPVIDDEAGKLMIQVIDAARKDCDSVGGVIETVVYGMPAGIGGPLFDGIEGKLAQIIYAVPAVKGVEFGYGFESSYLRGSENNDPFEYDKDGKVVLKTNKCGGILGGISVGGDCAPIVFSTAVKPTPSIGKKQQTVDLAEHKNTEIIIEGRHDPCIAPRAVPVIECAAAVAIYDMILAKEKEN